MFGTAHKNCAVDIFARHRLPQTAEAPNHEEPGPYDICDHATLTCGSIHITSIYNSQASQHYSLFFALQISIL